MKGIDIIEAMDRIDESLIIGAKQHKRSAPMWMRWVAMAACFCCIIAIGAFSIRSILTPVTEEVSPGALTSTPEETISVPPTTEPTEAPTVLLHSEKYDLDLSVPEEYVDEISIDTPYTFTYWTITEEILLNNAVFTFVDHTTQSLGGDGYVWTISRYTEEEFNWDDYNLYLEMDGLLNSLIIATDDTYVYELSHPSAIEQIAEGSRDSLTSYHEHCMAGYKMLEDFISLNNLKQNDEDLDRYYRHLSETFFSPQRTDVVIVTPSLAPTPTPTPIPTPTPSASVEEYPTYEIAEEQDVVEVIPTPTASPTPAPTPGITVEEYPAYAIMEEQIITTDGITFGADFSSVKELLGTPEEESDGIDNSKFLRYGGAHYTFDWCDACQDAHLFAFGADRECGTLMPFGFDVGTPLEDVLAYFNASDATPSMGNELYRVNDSHYAVYEPLSDTGLVCVLIYAEDAKIDIVFSRKNTIDYINIMQLSLHIDCPYSR